jgi:hypothetical protein
MIRTLDVSLLPVLPPPRTVKLIKKFLCKREGIPDVGSVDLLASALNHEPALDDDDVLVIMARDRPGSDPNEPMAVIIKDSLPDDIRTRALPVPSSSRHLIPFKLEPFSPSPVRLGP